MYYLKENRLEKRFFKNLIIFYEISFFKKMKGTAMDSTQFETYPGESDEVAL